MGFASDESNRSSNRGTGWCTLLQPPVGTSAAATNAGAPPLPRPQRTRALDLCSPDQPRYPAPYSHRRRRLPRRGPELEHDHYDALHKGPCFLPALPFAWKIALSRCCSCPSPWLLSAALTHVCRLSPSTIGEEDDGDAEEDEDPRSSPTTTMHRTVPASWLSPIAPFPLQYYSICFHCFSPSFAHRTLHFFVCKCFDRLHMVVYVDSSSCPLCLAVEVLHLFMQAEPEHDPSLRVLVLLRLLDLQGRRCSVVALS